MESLSKYITEKLQFPKIVMHHLQEGISFKDSFLRVDSESYAETLRTARQLYEDGKWEPTTNEDRMIVEKLNSGDKAIFKSNDRRKEVKVDIPMPNPDRTIDKKRFIVYRKTDKKDEESGLPIAKKIKFGSWHGNLDINNDDEGAVKSFWARQQCSKKSDPDTAGFWACYAPELFGDVLKLRGGKSRW